jgi:hypothetical protein
MLRLRMPSHGSWNGANGFEQNWIKDSRLVELDEGLLIATAIRDISERKRLEESSERKSVLLKLEQ